MKARQIRAISAGCGSRKLPRSCGTGPAPDDAGKPPGAAHAGRLLAVVSVHAGAARPSATWRGVRHPVRPTTRRHGLPVVRRPSTRSVPADRASTDLASPVRCLYRIGMHAGKGRGRVSHETLARRKKVGEFLRRRRLELGLSQGDMIKALNYANRNSISNVEIGIEGLPLKRVYQYAEVLKLPRDDFFRFVLGELEDLALTGYQRPRLKDQREKTLSDTEQDLLDNYRRLSKKYQDRVREHVREYLVVEGKEALSGSRLRRLGSRRKGA